MTREEIAEKLKAARIVAGLTQKKAAEKVGRKQQTLASWETGQSQPDANTLFLLCDVYGITVDELFGFTSKFNCTPKEKELINKYRTLNSKDQHIIDILINFYSSQDDDKLNSTQETVEENQEPLYNVVTFPLPDNRASAGFGDDLESDDVTMITAIANRDTIRADFAVRVDGHSMEPTYKDGDLVLVHRQPAVDVGAIGVFVANDKGYIKKQGEDRLVSINPDYPDVEPQDYYDYKCFGEVIGVLDPEWIIE